MLACMVRTMMQQYTINNYMYMLVYIIYMLVLGFRYTVQNSRGKSERFAYNYKVVTHRAQSTELRGENTYSRTRCL